jgi:hypothetical protein
MKLIDNTGEEKYIKRHKMTESQNNDPSSVDEIAMTLDMVWPGLLCI